MYFPRLPTDLSLSFKMEISAKDVFCANALEDNDKLLLMVIAVSMKIHNPETLL